MSDAYKALEGILNVETLDSNVEETKFRIKCATPTIKSLTSAYIISKANTLKCNGKLYKASRPDWKLEDNTTIILHYKDIDLMRGK